jgi:hypothetical protein
MVAVSIDERAVWTYRSSIRRLGVPPAQPDFRLVRPVAALADYRVIIRLAAPTSNVHYVDIDTSHFSGNEAPFSSVHALKGDTTKLSDKDPRWEEILPKVELGPNSRHIFELGSKGKEGSFSALMVGMIPDGGMVSHPSGYISTSAEALSGHGHGPEFLC